MSGVASDLSSKKDVCYLAESRNNELLLICQSIPLLAQFINNNLSNGESWDKVSITGLFDAMGRRDGRYGGYHKGKFRVRCVPLAHAAEQLESIRGTFVKALVIAGDPQSYETCA